MEALEIKCPVLAPGSRKDMITTGEAAVEIAERLNCGIHMYEEYGHAAFDEARDFYSRIYDYFLTGE